MLIGHELSLTLSPAFTPHLLTPLVLFVYSTPQRSRLQKFTHFLTAILSLAVPEYIGYVRVPFVLCVRPSAGEGLHLLPEPAQVQLEAVVAEDGANDPLRPLQLSLNKKHAGSIIRPNICFSDYFPCLFFFIFFKNLYTVFI